MSFRIGIAVYLLIAACVAADAQTSFWNWETQPTHALDMTPDGSRLLVTNTADDRVEIFDLSSGVPVWTASIPVGLSPVSVRARSNSEAWVVNQLSDSVSIVDLTTRNIRTTLSVGDEPADVVFAGVPQRAFVSVSQLNQVKVFDPANLAAAATVLPVVGEDPRALATDGVRVFVSIFESGNGTTILPVNAVSAANGPYGGQNPPPNAGAAFNPPLTPGLPPPPQAGLIVQKVGANWLDDNNHNWNAKVTWGVHDNDLAIINASTLGITYAKGLMNLNMALAVQPGSGRVTVVGTDAINAVRFEPNVRGRFVRVKMATVDPNSAGLLGNVDLNPHLTYLVDSIPQPQRDLSIGDPRGVVWVSASKGYVSGLGSNNLIVIDAGGARTGAQVINVGQGPTGLAYDAFRGRLYCMNRFDGNLSVIDVATDVELGRVAFYDPTPDAILIGRPFLYDTHRFSGLGQASCASCHIDGKMDNIAWDLGNPAGTVKTFNQSCNGGIPGGGVCENWHPMKGPMTTQTLVGIAGTEPLHWRGDREDLSAFSVAFAGLLAADASPTETEMDEFLAFIQTLKAPPNPNRTFFDGLPTSIAGFTGNPANGNNLFQTALLDGGALRCVDCHNLPTGSRATIVSGNLLLEPQSMKIPQLRNMYEKTGFSTLSAGNNRGFGFTHDGSIDNVFDFLNSPVFTFAGGSTGTTQRRDIEAFMMCFPSGTHPAVGTQLTVDGTNNNNSATTTLLNNMISVANSGAAGLIVKGVIGGAQRGGMYKSATGNFQMDRQAEVLSPTSLRTMAAAGAELTFTVVPAGTELRAGVDRDEDGYFDRDEIEACSNPNDPTIVPGLSAPLGDLTGDHLVGISDLAVLLSNYGRSPASLLDGDLDGNQIVDLVDLVTLLANYGKSCP